MPAFDANLMTRTTGNLTQSESSSAFKIFGTGVRGMTAYFAIPSTTGTTNQFLPQVLAGSNGTSWTLISQYSGGAQSWASGGKEYVVPFVTDKKYVQTRVVLSGSTGTPNFGVVKIGLVMQVGYDWTRAIDFSS